MPKKLTYTNVELIRVTADDSATLAKLAKLAGTTKSEFLRSLIRAIGQKLTQNN